MRDTTALLQAPDASTVKGKRDRAILAVLIGCALRRGELVGLTVADLQSRGTAGPSSSTSPAREGGADGACA